MTNLQSSDLRTSDLRTSDLRTSLHGLWLPLVTPFRNGELDEASLRRLVRHYAALPVDGLILAATTGESLTLTSEETERLVRVARDEAASAGEFARGFAGGFPVCLGLSNFTSTRWPIAPRIRFCSTTFPTGPGSISATRRCCGWPITRTLSG
jgi:4-hydroxy-tetrahydrodipicolinate synthase